jgi:hypothetical protein
MPAMGCGTHHSDSFLKNDTILQVKLIFSPKQKKTQQAEQGHAQSF